VTDHGYVRYARGCRCEVCRQAKADYMRDVRATQRQSRVEVEAAGGRYVANVTVHGYSAYQNVGCRCATCRAAKAEADARRWRGGTVDA